MTVRDVGFDASTVEASPDGTHVAVGGGAGELMVLDLATDEPVREPVTAHDKVVDLTYSAGWFATADLGLRLQERAVGRPHR